MSNIERISAAGGPPSAGMPAGSLAAAVEMVEGLGACSADYDALSDAELLAGQRDLARLRRLVETRSVWMAKTLAHRSRPELGQRGLAAQQGFTSPDELIQNLTGSTRKDALKLVDVGRMLADTEAAEAAVAARAGEDDADGARRQAEEPDSGADGDNPAAGDEQDGSGTPPGLFDESGCATGPTELPWHWPISRAVTAGTLSVAAAHAIRTGLGDVDSVITRRTLTDAVSVLLTEAKTMNVDRLLKRARRMRDSLDEAGIGIREKKAWDDRYLRIWTTDSGQVHLHGLFPPEQGEFILSTFDSLTGPRRGGVRFVDPDRAAWARAVQEDPRSTEQIAADTFLDLLKAGAEVDPKRILGGRAPAVRVLLTTPAPRAAGQPSTPRRAAQTRDGGEHGAGAEQTHGRAMDREPGTGAPTGSSDVLVSIPDGSGHGFIEGNPAPVSRETIDRLICSSGTIDVTFDPDGQPLNLGREERIFTQAQRIALAARDGGCRWRDCDKPPSRTEAHHLDQWVRDRGLTDIRVGILLCGPHHRLLHAQGWQIFEHRGTYWLRPPAAVDPGQRLVELPSKSDAAPPG